MMGPVLRNLDKKKAVSIRDLLCGQNKPFIAEQRGEGEPQKTGFSVSCLLYNNVALIS